MNNLPNAVFYGRVSTDRQDTYDEQLADVRHFCKHTDGLALDEQATFYETGVTADYFSHDAYRRMLDYIRKHPNIRYIVVRDLSRFGRPGHTVAEAERHRLKIEFAVTVLSVLEPYLNEPTSPPKLNRWGNPQRDPNSPMRPVMRALKDETNREIREEIGEKSREGIVASYSAGHAHGGPVPQFFVFEKTDELDENDDPIYIIKPDPETAPHHQAMFDFIASGGSFAGLSRWLPEHGIFNKGVRYRDGRIRGNVGKPMSPSTLRDRMLDYKFIGQMVYNRFWPKGPDNPTGRRMRPKEFWTIFENYCEPTVDPRTFFKVQDIIERGERLPLRNAVLLTGLLHCGVCGRRMHAVPSGKSHVYRCNGKKLKRDKKCPSSEVQVRALDSLIENRLLNDFFSAEYLERFFCHQLPEILDRHKGARDAAKREITQRMQELGDEIAQAESVQGAPSKMIEEYVHRRRAELNSLKRRLESGDTLRPRQVGFSNLVNFGDLSAALRGWWEKAKLRERRELLRLVFAKLIFTRSSRRDDGDLEIHTRLSAFTPNRSVQRGESGIQDAERLRSPREVVRDLSAEDTLALPDDILMLVAALQEKYEKIAQATR